jgi:hypothetical protein
MTKTGQKEKYINEQAIYGILKLSFPLEEFAGTTLWPSREQLHNPAKHPINNLDSIIRQWHIR